MPLKTSSGKWKWGNIERSSKKELVQTVYGIWKKNGSKGSFSDFWHGNHKVNEDESNSNNDKWFNIVVDGKKVGRYGLSFYDDIKAIGIGDLEIFPEYRNKGYGTKIIKDIVSKYKDSAELIYCFVDKNNTDAIRLYKRLGIVSDKPNSNDQYYVEFYNRKKLKKSSKYEPPWTLDQIQQYLPDKYEETS